MEVDELSQAMLGPLDTLNEFANLGYFFQCSLGFLEQSFITGGTTSELLANSGTRFLGISQCVSWRRGPLEKAGKCFIPNGVLLLQWLVIVKSWEPGLFIRCFPGRIMFSISLLLYSDNQKRLWSQRERRVERVCRRPWNCSTFTWAQEKQGENRSLWKEREQNLPTTKEEFRRWMPKDCSQPRLHSEFQASLGSYLSTSKEKRVKVKEKQQDKSDKLS